MQLHLCYLCYLCYLLHFLSTWSKNHRTLSLDIGLTVSHQLAWGDFFFCDVIFAIYAYVYSVQLLRQCGFV